MKNLADALQRWAVCFAGRLINTPLQWGGSKRPKTANRFSGFHAAAKTAEAVGTLFCSRATPLKWGVNERRQWKWLSAGRVSVVLAALIPSPALAQDAVRLLAAKDKELHLPFAATTNLAFVCDWDASKKPTVLEFNGRIDTPTLDASTGGPVEILRIELNGVLLDGSRLLNKPLTSPRLAPGSSEVVWYNESHWKFMYCGSWTPPDNDYTPKQGSPVRFVIEISDLVRRNTTNTITLTYPKIMVGEQTLAEHCRKSGLGDATIVLGELQVRPRKESDAFQAKKD